MHAKLLTIVLASGAIALVLLVNRQRRIETSHQMSQTHQRMMEQQRALWMLRREVAERCRQDRIRELMQRVHDQWKPIPGHTKPLEEKPMQLVRRSDSEYQLTSWGG